MKDYFPYIRPLLFKLKEETAHHFVIAVLRSGFIPPGPPFSSPMLKTRLWGLDFPNPMGLAAGFDKDADAPAALLGQGFGFVECGTVTPLPQPGNPKPRLFRLEEDRAIINRFGFNSKGADYFERQFDRKPRHGITGINIGKNKESTDAVADYVTLFKRFYALGDYITVNISSPNTPNLREMQKKGPLDELLGALAALKPELARMHGIRTPVLLKIAPDITAEDKEYIAAKALEYQLDGLIIGNTTLSRAGLKDTLRAQEAGGMSGTPLFTLSTQVLKDMYRLTGGKVPIVGAGGISNGAEAYAKVRAGASLVQVYTTLIYQGFDVVRRINAELETLLKKDGLKNIAEAVGLDNKIP